MKNNNPYTSPTSDIRPKSKTNQPAIFVLNGRIGRIRYLTYSIIITISFYIMFGIIGAVTPIMMGDPTLMMRQSAEGAFSNAAILFVFVGLYIPLFICILIFSKRRFNDLNHTGWFILLSFIPLINLIVVMYLLSWPGTEGDNDYGPAPEKNSWGLIATGIIMSLFIIAILGMLAAIAIPAYQEYTERARQNIEQQKLP